MKRLKKRRDYVRVSKTGRRAGGRFLSLQIVFSEPDSGMKATCRVGFTATKKVGNAVERNRARRRMRVLADSVLSEYVVGNVDCVLVARRSMLEAKFVQLADELRRLLVKLGLGKQNMGAG